MKQRHQRTLKRAVRLHDMKIITCDDLIYMSLDEYHEIRRSATRARLDGVTEFCCEQCGFSVYAPREPKTKLPFWKHHKGAPLDCPWWTGEARSPDAVSGSQFQGAQESPLHFRIKNLVANILNNDPLTKPESVVVDKYIIGENERRRPDVRAVYDGRPVAIEIQLATTQIPIIVAREDFYREEGVHLIWLTWNFMPEEKPSMLTAFEDIFYSHNKNIFSICDNLATDSMNRKIFLIRAFWKRGEIWESRVVELTELNWPLSGLPFVVPPLNSWGIEFRDRWLKATPASGTPWEIQDELLGELASRLGFEGDDLCRFGGIKWDVSSLLNAILSFKEGRPVGSSQSNLIEVINTFLNSEKRFQFAQIIRHVVVQTVGPEFLKRESVLKKVNHAMSFAQEETGGIIYRIVRVIFPEIFHGAGAQLIGTDGVAEL